MDFLHETDSNNYDKSQSDFETAKERVWEGFQIHNGHYYQPRFYSDGTVVKAGDIGDKNSPSQMHDDEYLNQDNIFGNMKLFTKKFVFQHDQLFVCLHYRI